MERLAGEAIVGHDPQHAPAQEDPCHQLAEDRGLADALGELTEQLGGDEDGGEGQNSTRRRPR